MVSVVNTGGRRSVGGSPVPVRGDVWVRPALLLTAEEVARVADGNGERVVRKGRRRSVQLGVDGDQGTHGAQRLQEPEVRRLGAAAVFLPERTAVFHAR